MKVVGRVLQTGPMAKQSENDQKKGLRFLTIVREEVKKTIGQKTYGEFLIYAIKTTDDPELVVESRYLIDGRIWELKDSDQVTIRGFTNPTFTPMPDEDQE